MNAYKTPCCEQLIDESCELCCPLQRCPDLPDRFTGHSTLPTTCPVCEHTPLSAADCNPNKAMRSTVRVFLKTELKKRETSRAKEAKESAPPTPVDSRPNSRVATGNLELAAAEPVKDTAPAAATDGSKESQQPKPARDEAISENAEMRVSVEAPTHEVCQTTRLASVFIANRPEGPTASSAASRGARFAQGYPSGGQGYGRRLEP